MSHKPKHDAQNAPPPGGEPAVAATTDALAPPPPLATEAIEDLKSRAAKAEENWDRLLRTTADFENFKKRAARERSDAVKFANEALLTRLLPVLDNLEMALAAGAGSAGDSAQSLQAGVEMICQQFKRVLKESGLEDVDATGKAFDPNVHEAVSQLETSTVPEGHVAQQIRKGYRLYGRLLRPAGVVVAKAPATPEKPDAH